LLLFNPTLEAFIAVGIIILVAFPIHEFAHAMAAFQLGDSTAKLFGRVTLDPRAHIDPMGAILLAIAGFGWAKPTPVNPYNLRGGRSGEALVALAGPLSNLVLAALAALPLRYIITVGLDVPPVVFNTLVILVSLNLLLMVFNLIPIPPLDGSKVLFAVMDRQTEMRWRPVLEQYGFLILIAAVFLPILPNGQTLVGGIVLEVLDPLYELLVGGPRGFIR
jgi:Zn-dependent protease